jgi:hypothetical protein
MKEANENILKLLLTNIDDSVIVLEQYLTSLKAATLFKPTSQCFTNINAETGEYDLVWSNGSPIDLQELNLLIKYDLAQYYFLKEDYRKCFSLLNAGVKHSIRQNKYLSEYCVNFESLSSVCELLFDEKSLPIANQIDESEGLIMQVNRLVFLSCVISKMTQQD